MITKTRLPYLIAVLTYPLADAAELARLTHRTQRSMQRNLRRFIDDGLVAAVHRGTPTIPPTLRYYPTGLGMRVAARALDMPLGELVKQFPLSRQWLEILSARIDTVATTYRIASTIANLIDTTGPINVIICRDKPLDAGIRLPDGRLIGIVREGVVARRKSIAWRIRALRRMPYETFPSLLVCLAQTRADANRTRRYGERGYTGRRFFRIPGEYPSPQRHRLQRAEHRETWTGQSASTTMVQPAVSAASAPRGPQGAAPRWAQTCEGHHPGAR